MKTFVVFLFAVLAFAVGEARATQEVVVENGALIVREKIETMRIPGVPRWLSADAAHKLVTGELKTATVHPLHPSFDFSLSSSGTTITEEYADEAVTYCNGAWTTRAAPSRFERDGGVVAFFFVWLPVLSITMLSIWGGLYWETRWNALLICYAAVFIGIASATIFQSMGVGLILGVLAGAGTGVAITEGLVGILLGIASGGVMGLFADLLVSSQNPQGVMRYTLFMVMVALVSFAIALVVKWVKERTVTAMRSASSH